MSEPICECYYDAALHKQSTNCPLHDPYVRCKDLEKQLATLETKLTRRDAAFAALVDANAELVGAMSRLLEYARFGHHVEDKEKFEAAHDKGREALKLAEGVDK